MVNCTYCNQETCTECYYCGDCIKTDLHGCCIDPCDSWEDPQVIFF